MTKPRGGHLEPVEGEATPRRSDKVRTSFLLPRRWKEWLDEEAARQHVSMAAVILRAISDYAGRHTGRSSWDVDDDPGVYDPNMYYTASQDRHGHSFHLRVNIPKPLAAEMASLIQAGEVPQYRSMEDIARDSIVHRVKRIAQMIGDGELENVVDLAALRSMEQGLIDQQEDAEGLLTLIRENIARKRNQPTALKAYLAERAEYAEHFPEPWRTDLLDLIDKEKKRLRDTTSARTRRSKRT